MVGSRGQSWCRSFGREPLSGDADTLALYACAGRGLSPASLRVHLAAIQAAHRLAGVALDPREPRLAMVLEGIARSHGTQPRRRAAAAGPDALRLMLAARPPGTAIPEVAAWRRGWLRAGEGVPALLAAEAVARWMREAGEGDLARPEPQQALFLAAVLLKRRWRLGHVPLVFWAGAGPGERLPRPTGDPAAWPGLFLTRLAAAARKGLEVLDRLEAAQQRLAALAEGARRSSSLPTAAELVLRRPLVTAPQLARDLGLTHQGALLILARLQKARIAQEVTGRGSFRAYAVNVTSHTGWSST